MLHGMGPRREKASSLTVVAIRRRLPCRKESLVLLLELGLSLDLLDLGGVEVGKPGRADEPLIL